MPVDRSLDDPIQQNPCYKQAALQEWSNSKVADAFSNDSGWYNKIRLFSSIWATSAATGQAAWMAAQIYAEYPEIWPETVRGLMVHSARWTQKMYDQFCVDDKKTSGRRNLVRSCGYGIPDFEHAIQCVDNSVNMIIEGELQPYKMKAGGGYSMNEMHLHTLPWPKEVLENLGEVNAELRVTLSYFIEPGPGEVGWKDKYTIRSHFQQR